MTVRRRLETALASAAALLSNLRARLSPAPCDLVGAVLCALAALFLIFAKHSKEDDDEEDQNQTVAMNEEEDPEQLKRKRIYKWISGLTAVISVIVFVLTENMRLPMVLVDKWTLLMVVFFLINAVTLYLGRRWHEDEDDEEQTQA